MYMIQDQLFLSLRINSQDIDMSLIYYNYFCLRTHILLFLPSLDFEFIDPMDVIRKNVLKDGSIVEIAMSNENEEKPSYREFRVFRCTQRSVPGGIMYHVVCYYNAPRYILEKKTKAFDEQSSSSVVEQLGGEVGLSVDADSTSDTQTWICRNYTYAQWLRKEILLRCYSSDTSAYVAGVSYLTGKLLFKNLPDLMTKSPTKQFSDRVLSSDPSNIISDVRVKSYNGLFNAAGGGYGFVSKGYDLLEDDYQQTSGASVKKAKGVLNIADDLQGNTSRFDFDPINVGNVHDKYYTAKNQNTRILASYSSGLEILVLGYSRTDILDPVSAQISYLTDQTRQDDYVTNPYVVIGKASMIKSSMYADKYALLRNNINIPR